MSLFLFHGVSSSQPPKLFFKINDSFKTNTIISASILPARDKIIDFGKHKGKMLGTLPSKYLKWVSKNLRARDFEDWAKLADEVLEDPVYKDRLEWEFAQNLLTGDYRGNTSTDSSVDDLVEFSQRFDWDNEDKLGWSRIDFSLLGTSKGGRIPRKNDSLSENFETLGESSLMKKKKNKLRDEVGEKREVRIERQRMKRVLQMNTLEDKNDVGVDQEQMLKLNKTFNPFPGRESLLRKAISRRRSL